LLGDRPNDVQAHEASVHSQADRVSTNLHSVVLLPFEFKEVGSDCQPVACFEGRDLRIKGSQVPSQV
jgi:hypothetical protein